MKEAAQPKAPPLRVVALVSGHGSLLPALAPPPDGCEVVGVFSNRPECPALARAATLWPTIPRVALDHRDFASREAFDLAMASALAPCHPRVIVLLGYARIVTQAFLDAVAVPVLNVHPSLLPAFPGQHAVAQALTAGVTTTGCTVHYVDRGVDTGPVLAQTPVPVLPDDDEATLHRRIQTAEISLLRQVLAELATAPLS